MKYSNNGNGKYWEQGYGGRKVMIPSPALGPKGRLSKKGLPSASKTGDGMSIENIVRDRYAQGAQAKEEALCCPTNYDPKYLKVIPGEILEKDYGCGDPSRFLKEGDTVLDLGSGGGKICYIASQVVGPKGRVIGVDFNPAMLALARKYQKEVGNRIGWHNVEFLRGRIQDLRTDLETLDENLKKEPIASADDFLNVQEAMIPPPAFSAEGRSSFGRRPFRPKAGGGMKSWQHAPLIEDESIDVIVSNCVLNLVRPEDKRELFREMHRVLRKGGRVAISDIVSDETVPKKLQSDPELWSGCISGAFQEKEFLKAFEEAGFYGIKIEKFDERPWKIVHGIEFRSITITAYKGKEGPCWERNQAVIYKGPWKQVVDDDGHILKRGVRTAVCDKTYQIYSKTPYQNDFILVPPSKDIPLSKAKPFSATKKADPSSGGDCHRTAERDPRETKGKRYRKTTKVQSTCMDGGGGCC